MAGELAYLAGAHLAAAASAPRSTPRSTRRRERTPRRGRDRAVARRRCSPACRPRRAARFERLHARCVEMRHLAAGVRGASGTRAGSAEEIRTPGLDRLLWLFLRLLMSKTALDRFLQTMNSEEITARLEQLRKT